MCWCCFTDCMYLYILFDLFFFKQKTAYEMRISDWSSDVCSSDLAIRIGHARKQLVGDRDLARIVAGRDPQTQHVGAECLGDLLRRDDIAERLRHLDRKSVV